MVYIVVARYDRCGSLPLMTKLNRGSHRRRWIWTLLFILLATVSMVGPTQAVSGLVAASAAVMEAISAALGQEEPAPSAPVAAPNLARSFDELMTPDFTALVGQAPSSPAAEPGDSVPAGQPAAAASAASSQTGTQSSSGYNGGTGSPGYGGGGASRSGSGSPGSGGMGSSNSGAFSQEIAEASSTSESSGPLVTDTLSDNIPGLDQGHVPSVEDDTRAFGPSAPGTGPASGGSPSSDVPPDIDLSIPDNNAMPQPSVPTFSANPPSNGTTPTDSHPVPPAVLDPLLDELDIPSAVARPGTASDQPCRARRRAGSVPDSRTVDVGSSRDRDCGSSTTACAPTRSIIPAALPARDSRTGRRLVAAIHRGRPTTLNDCAAARQGGQRNLAARQRSRRRCVVRSPGTPIASQPRKRAAEGSAI